MGAILAHSLRAGAARMFKQGRAPVRGGHRKRWTKPAIREVTVARLDAGDVAEDEAAARIARPAPGAVCASAPRSPAAPISMPKANGLAMHRRGPAGQALNAIDESMTFATLAPYAPCRAAPDAGHGQDHPVCGAARGRRRRPSDCWPASPPIAVAPFMPQTRRADLHALRRHEAPPMLDKNR